MRNPKGLRLKSTHPVALLVLMLMVLSIHTPARAGEFYECFFNLPFGEEVASSTYVETGPGFPSSPGIGDPTTMSILFSCAGPGTQPNANWTMSAGGLTLTATPALLSEGLASFDISWWGYPLSPAPPASAGLPVFWGASIQSSSSYPFYILDSFSFDNDGPEFGDSVTYEPSSDPSTWTTESYYFLLPGSPVSPWFAWEGGWNYDPTVVPLPATVLLFGAGLIPLLWASRKKRLGQ